MRFSNGFFGENEATLGTLRFSAMRREVFEENADGTPSEVKLVNPMFGAIAHVTFGNSAEVDWYIKADDLVLKTPAQNSQPHKDVPADKKS